MEIAPASDTPEKTTADKKAELAALVKQYQALTDPKQRHEFYHDNPRLKEKFSEGNHPKD